MIDSDDNNHDFLITAGFGNILLSISGKMIIHSITGKRTQWASEQPL